MDHKIILFVIIILFYFLLMMRSMKLALLVYLFLCPFNIFVPIGIKNINSTEAVALMFIIVWLISLLRKERPWIPDTAFTAPLFFYFIASLTMIISTGLTTDVIRLIIRHFQFFGVFMILVTYFKDRKDIYAISNALIASLAALCFVAIIELVFVYGGFGIPWQRSILWKEGLIDIGLYPGTDLAIKRLISASGRAGLASVFPFATPFGIHLGSLIFLLFWRIHVYKTLNKKKIGMMLLLFISIVILILTKGRTAVFSFVLSTPLIVLIVKNRRSRFKIVLVVTVLLVLIFSFVPNIIIDPVTEFVDKLSPSGRTSLREGDLTRVDYFLDSMKIFFKYPLTGVGNRIFDFNINPHSAITQALVLKGILGGLTLFWVLVRIFRVSNRNVWKIRQNKVRNEDLLSIGWLLSIAIFFGVQSIGVILFGYILMCIPVLAAMSMFVLSKKSLAAEERLGIR